MTGGIYLRVAALIGLVAGIVFLSRLNSGGETHSNSDRPKRESAQASSINDERAYTRSRATAVETAGGSTAGPLATPAEGPSVIEKGSPESKPVFEPEEGAGALPQHGDRADALQADTAASVESTITLLPNIQKALETMAKSQDPATLAALKRQREMQDEPEDAWSRDTEASLSRYIAAQPESGGVKALIRCRATQCLIQMSDLQGNTELSLKYVSPSEAIFYRMQRQSWFMQALRHFETQMIVSDNRPHFIGFFDRA
jgi:hypothetical protein